MDPPMCATADFECRDIRVDAPQRTILFANQPIALDLKKNIFC